MAEGLELGKAYVQIIPSAKGIKGKLSEALGNAPAQVGESAGQSLGGKMVSAIKTAIAAAGIGMALSKALTEGAALEQSIGGVETLFKDSADTIKQYAAEAYKTAGVSANSYMEQVTSFSATLLQGLGGDTQAAAQYANQAIVQMSDNANKFGTDIASIQYAYQGFAKDNYTLLDNLKLGYGGTQSEMARLINDSGVLGDSIEVTAQTVNDVPFDKIIEAIGVIQDNLGMTGTTAKEAATTLSGSLASVKAAFSNVLGNLTLGQDITPALNGLADTVTTFLVGNLLPAVWNILKALPSGLVTFVQSLVPQLTATLPSFLSEVVSSITTAAPQMMQAATEMIGQLGQGLVTAIPALAQKALPVLLGFTDSLRSNFGQIVDAGIGFILNLMQGIMNSLPTLIAYVPQIVSNLAGLINDNAPKLLAAAGNLILMLIQGLVASVPALLSNMGNIIQAVADVITAINWINLGTTVIKAIGSGLKSMAGHLSNMMGETFKGAIDYIKSLPQMALQWGKDMIQGFINGILGSIGGIIDAVKNVGSTIASYLHFSRPDVGPLREYETWMPDFMGGLADGISGNAASVEKAVAKMAQEMAYAVDTALNQPRLGAMEPAQRAFTQNIYFEQPMQAPDEIARALRIQQQYGLAGAR